MSSRAITYPLLPKRPSRKAKTKVKAFLGHRALTARCFQYFAKISREQYKGRTLSSVIDKLFGCSYKSAVSALVREEKITVDELKELIASLDEERKDL